MPHEALWYLSTLRRSYLPRGAVDPVVQAGRPKHRSGPRTVTLAALEFAMSETIDPSLQTSAGFAMEYSEGRLQHGYKSAGGRTMVRELAQNADDACADDLRDEESSAVIHSAQSSLAACRFQAGAIGLAVVAGRRPWQWTSRGRVMTGALGRAAAQAA